MNNKYNRIKAAARNAAIRCHLKKEELQQHFKQKLQEENGQFVMDNAVVFVIIIVLGGAGLLLLTNYLNDELSVTLKDKINDFFN